MAGLKVFVSSTCYDLSVIRSQLRLFIENLGHIPIMSDYNDVLYDHRIHTHTSCIEEVANSDIVVLIIGSRYGGAAVPEAIRSVDFEKLDSTNIETIKSQENISITQLEVLRAAQIGIPIYTFIDDGVWHDHALYEKNKSKDIVSSIEFPSIQKQETAKFIFEFINFLRLQRRGNSVFQFAKLQDIEEIMCKQLSGLLQRLLSEARDRSAAGKRFDDLTEQFEDLKTAILASIGNTNGQANIARGVVRYRRLIDFIRALRFDDLNFIKNSQLTWSELLERASISNILDRRSLQYSFDGRYGPKPSIFMIKNDGTFFEGRMSVEFIQTLESDWNIFIKLSEDIKSVIIDALLETGIGAVPLRYNNSNFEEYLNGLRCESERMEVHRINDNTLEFPYIKL